MAHVVGYEDPVERERVPRLQHVRVIDLHMAPSEFPDYVCGPLRRPVRERQSFELRKYAAERIDLVLGDFALDEFSPQLEGGDRRDSASIGLQLVESGVNQALAGGFVRQVKQDVGIEQILQNAPFNFLAAR